MPGRFKTECKKPGCHNLTDNADGYCDEHQQECKPLRRYDDKRGSSAQRGYGSRWRRYRIWFLKHHPVCAVCGRLASVVDHIVPHKGTLICFGTATTIRLYASAAMTLKPRVRMAALAML